MTVLRNVLETLPFSSTSLEAFSRNGDVVRQVSGAELVDRVLAWRAAIRRGELGNCVSRSRRVVGLLFRPEETIEFLVAAFAAMAERSTVVPLYPNWPAETQLEYLRAYGLRALAVGRGYAERAQGWLGDALDDVAVIDLDAPLPDPGLAGGVLRRDEVFPHDLPADHPCAWIFTSGTSGKLAKLTEITLENVEAAIENIVALDFLRPGMTLHCPLSTSHIFAFVVVLGFLALRPRRLLFSDIQYLARLPQSRTGRVDGLIVVPIVLNRLRARFYEGLMAVAHGGPLSEEFKKLVKIPLRARRALKRVLARAEEAVIDLETRGRVTPASWSALQFARRLFGRKIRQRLGSPEFVVVGGAKPNLHAMAFLEVMGVRCLQGWGMTETTGPLAVCRPRDRFRGAFGTCGRLFPKTRGKIENGELVVEGPQVARGYLEPGGDFVPFHGSKRTGDLAEFDPAGRLRILGKASDRITTDNGINYNPVPLEEGLIALDLERDHLLEEVVVLGEGQPRLGAVFFLREGVAGGGGGAGGSPGPGPGLDPRPYLRKLLGDFNAGRSIDERVEAWTVSGEPFKESGLLGPSGKLVRRRAEERFAGMFQPAVGAAR